MPKLGLTVKSQLPVKLSPEGRAQGTYVLGVNGSGKTTVLKNIILQDMEEGDGVALLDPHGDLTEELLRLVPKHRLKDVILFDPSDIEYPMGLNMLECDDPSDLLTVNLIQSEVMTTLYKLFFDSWGPRMESILRNTVLAVMDTPDSTILDMLLMISDPEKREGYVSRIKNPVVRHYWTRVFPAKFNTAQEWGQAPLNKLDKFLASPVIRNITTQSKSALNLRKVMDKGQILFCNLSKGKIGADNAALIGSTMVGKILIAALSRAELPAADRRPFHLFVDEYQSFATESFPTLQSEARKYGLDTIVAHQYRDQLDDLNKGSTLNVGNFIVFRASGPDAQELAVQFDNTPPEPPPTLQAIPRRTGRDDVYRTTGDQVFVPGQSRPYSDVERETANQLANTPNYHAHVKLIQDGVLVEYYIRTELSDAIPNEAQVEEIRRQSRQLAIPRAEVEERIASLWADDETRTYQM